MSGPPEPQTTEPPTPLYRIVVAGALDPAWSGRAAGMALVVHAHGDAAATTELIGHLADQASLMGVIDRLYSYGATLLSVEWVPPGCGGGDTRP